MCYNHNARSICGKESPEMNKKSLFFILAALVIALFASFALCEETVWDRDINEHWILNEDEERTQVGAHKMNDILCEVCQSEIWLFEDGSCDISNYNEHDDLIRYSYYDETGACLDDYVYVYTYDEAGLKLVSSTYYFGLLVEESEYQVDPFGESVLLRTIGYNDDGSVSVNECDKYGNTVVSRMTDQAGIVIFEETYEYTYGEDGFPTHTLQVSRFDDGTVLKSETDAMGNRLFSTQIDPDGTVLYAYTYTYEYDEAGRMVRELVTEGERYVFESLYAYTGDVFDIWGYQYMTIDYMEDGSKTVCEIDEFGEIISETMYDAQGNIVS